MIEARIIADSVTPREHRLTSFILTYPRFIHSELMTHRMFSRNAASSRAIPISRMITSVIREPAMPVSWGQNGKGMQAGKELSGWRRSAVVAIARGMRFQNAAGVWMMSKLGAHKQVSNRYLEPWAHMTTIVTATEFGNFFNLRAHKDAQPEFQELAFKMLAEHLKSLPRRLKFGDWHLPFADKYLEEGPSTAQLLKIVTARCARISYMNFEGDIDHEKDYELHDSLLRAGHVSPFEHAAMAADTDEFSGNFRGYIQYRKTLANENRSVFSASELLARRNAS